MTGQCLLCRQLIRGKPVLELAPDRAERELLSLGVMMAGHIAQHHADVLKRLGTWILRFHSLVYLYFLEPVEQGENDAAPELVRLRDALRCELVRWLDQPAPITVNRVMPAPAAGASSGHE